MVFFMRLFTRPAPARAVALVVAVGLGLVGRSACAAESEWLDVEGRIQYGFYTEDARTLSDVVAQLSGPDGGDDPLLHYYVGLAKGLRCSPRAFGSLASSRPGSRSPGRRATAIWSVP
jgi:hypothetical protein